MPRPPVFIKLTPARVRKLKKLLKETARKSKLRERRRANAVWISSDQRWTIKQIAEFLGCSRISVYQWFKRFRQKGVAGLARPPRKTKLTPQQIDKILEVSLWKWAYKDKTATKMKWSFRKIAAWVKNEWGIKISHVSIRRIIRQRLLGGWQR
jgi:transposase